MIVARSPLLAAGVLFDRGCRVHLCRANVTIKGNVVVASAVLTEEQLLQFETERDTRGAAAAIRKLPAV